MWWLTKFEFHFTEFLTKLFRLDDPFNPKWKLTFLATLPNWFAKKVTKVFPDDMTKYAWGFIRKWKIGEIVSTCNQMKMAIASLDSSKGHSYNKLCKEYHISTSSTSNPRKKKNHESSSPPASNFQGGRRHVSRKRIVHKRKPQFKRNEPFIAPKRHSQNKAVICYICGSHDGLLAPNCPTLKKQWRQDKEAKKKTQVFYRNK